MAHRGQAKRRPAGRDRTERNFRFFTTLNHSSSAKVGYSLARFRKRSPLPHSQTCAIRHVHCDGAGQLGNVTVFRTGSGMVVQFEVGPKRCSPSPVHERDNGSETPPPNHVGNAESVVAVCGSYYSDHNGHSDHGEQQQFNRPRPFPKNCMR